MGSGNRYGCGAFCHQILFYLLVLLWSTQKLDAAVYTYYLNEPLPIGSRVIYTGTPTDAFPRFGINMGPPDKSGTKDEIAVHFNPRIIPERYVTRNTRDADLSWGPEENSALRPFPFKMGQQFTIEMLLDENETVWAVDGEYYCSYAHRNPSPLNATWVQVYSITNAALKIEMSDLYRQPAHHAEVPRRPKLYSLPIQIEPNWQPNVIATLTNGLPEGQQIVIQGRLRPMLHSFAIDLLDKPQDEPCANILLTVHVRRNVDSEVNHQYVMLNTWLRDSGMTSREEFLYIVPGTSVTVRIKHDACKWQIFVDSVLVSVLEDVADKDVRAIRLRGDLFPEQIYTCPCH